MGPPNRNPGWRRRLAQAICFIVGEQTDEAGELVYPIIDPRDPEYWFGAHRSEKTAMRHAYRLNVAMHAIDRQHAQ